MASPTENLVSFNALTKPWGLLKLAELIIAIICIALLRHYDLHFGGEMHMSSFRDRYLVGVITIGGMILVTIPLLVSYIYGPVDNYRPALELIYTIVGFALFLTSGALCLEYYHNYTGGKGNINAGKSLGALLVINSFFFLLDAIVAFRMVYE